MFYFFQYQPKALNAESSIEGDDSIEDEVDDNRAEEIRKYGKYLLPSVDGYESDTSVVLVLDKLESQIPTLTDEENYQGKKKPDSFCSAESCEDEKLDSKTVIPLETKFVLDGIVSDAKEGEPSTQQVKNVTQFDGETTLVHKVPIEGEKLLVTTSKSDYTSVSLKDLIPEEEITATQRVNELKVDINTNLNIQKNGKFLDGNKELQSLSRSPVEEENMEVFSNSKDKEIDFSNLPEDEIPRKEAQEDVTALPTKDEILSGLACITTQYTNTLHQKEAEQDSDGDNDLKKFAIQIQKNEKISLSNIEEEVHVKEKADLFPVFKENSSSRSYQMTEKDIVISHEVVQEPDYQAFSHKIDSSVKLTDPLIGLGERPDDLDVSSKQDIIKSASTAEHGCTDGTAYEADKTSNLLIADKEEIDERAIEAVQIQGSEFEPFSFDALDEGPFDQSNEMNELNFMTEPRVDFKVEHVDDEHVEDKKGDVPGVTSHHENDKAILGYPMEFLSSSQSEETFSIAQPDKGIIKTKMDRLQTEPNMDKEGVDSKENENLPLIVNGQPAGENLKHLRSENLANKDRENQKKNIEDDANIIFTSVHQRVSKFEDEKRRREASKPVLSPRMSAEGKKGDVPPVVTEEHLTKLRSYGNIVMPSEDIEASDMIFEKLPVTIESGAEEMVREKEEKNTTEWEDFKNIQAVDTSANETEKALTNICEKELQGSTEREIDKDEQTQKIVSIGSIPFFLAVQDFASDENVVTRSDEKDEKVTINADISTNDDVTYQQIELLKPLETVELRSSPIQPIRDTIAGENIESVMVKGAAIKPPVDIGDIGDVIDPNKPIEIRATESNIEPDQMESKNGAPVLLANYSHNAKLDFSKGVQRDIEKKVNGQEFIVFEETAPIVPQVLKEELKSEEADRMSTKVDANQRPMENQAETMDHQANVLKEVQVTGFISAEDIEKYRQAGKMVLPGNDDIDQMIIEVAPEDSEIQDSSKGYEVVETKPVKVKEESSDEEIDGEKEGDNRAKWEAVENMQARGTSKTETLIDVTKQELQGSMEINKEEQTQNNISFGSSSLHAAVHESVVPGSLAKDESEISNAAMSANDDVAYQQIKLLKPLETVELSSTPIQPIRDTIAGEDIESVMVNDAAAKLPLDMQDDIGVVTVDAGKAIEIRAIESNVVEQEGIEFKKSVSVNTKTVFSKGVQIDIEKNVSEQESIEFEDTSPTIPHVLREETESAETDSISAKGVLNKKPIEKQTETMNHQVNLRKEEQVTTFVSEEDIERHRRAGKMVLPSNDEIDQMIIEIVPRNNEIGDSSKEGSMGTKSVQGKGKVGPIINQDDEKVVALSSKEMEDSYLKLYTLSKKGTSYTGKNVDVEDVTDTAVLQTLVDETTRIHGRDVNSGAPDKKQTVEEDVVEPKHLEFQETTPVIPTEVENETVANGEEVDSTETLEIDIKQINSEQECIELVETKPIIPILVQTKSRHRNQEIFSGNLGAKDYFTKRTSGDVICFR